MTTPEPAHALLVVDVQQWLVADRSAVPGAAAFADRVAELATRARAAGVPVVQVQNDGPAGAMDEPGSPGWGLLLSDPSDIVVRKHADDGFDGTPLADVLAARRVRRVAVCGALSELCVSATVRGALARGLAVVLPRDGHATYDLDDIPASVVRRVAEHVLGDEPEFACSTTDVTFAAPGPRPTCHPA